MRILVLDTVDANLKGFNPHGRYIYQIIKSINPSADITCYKVTDDNGNCINNHLAEGLVYGLFGGFDIINISLGLPFMSEEVQDLINKISDKGVIVACASGNNVASYPALHDKAISVGATDKEGNKTAYTMDNYDILCLGEHEVNGKLLEGTSFACAYFVGLLSKGGGHNGS